MLVESLRAIDNIDMHGLLAGITVPTLAVHGTLDKIVPYSHAQKMVAAIPGARLATFEGGGHLLFGRDAVKVNRLIRDFVLDRPGETATVPDRPERAVPVATPPAPARRPRPDGQRKILWLSSPIGLGHIQRDLAIARRLRERHPDVTVDFLAAAPADRVVRHWGERLHPATALLQNETGHFEGWAADHELHAFNALWDMDEIMTANFMAFADVVERERYDLWVGDEGWDLDYYLHENPDLKRAPYVFLTDFVGLLPMREDRSSTEFIRCWEKNAENIDHLREHPDVRDLSILVGDEEDVLDRDFGPDLPNMRQWARENFKFSGYTYHFDPAAFHDRAALRRRLGYREDERVILASVGGTRVGRGLLEKCAQAFSLIASQIPEARMVLVAGPRAGARPLPAPSSRGTVVRAGSLRAPRRRRPGHRAGRAHHHDGAGRGPHPVPVLPAPQPLRAAAPRGAPARPARGRRPPRLRPHQPRGARRLDPRAPGQARARRPDPTRRHRPRGRPHRGAALTRTPDGARAARLIITTERRTPWHSE